MGTPHARIIRETMKAWFELLNKSPDNITDDIRVAWPKAKAALLDSKLSINNVRGILKMSYYSPSTIIITDLEFLIFFRYYFRTLRTFWIIKAEMLCAKPRNDLGNSGKKAKICLALLEKPEP